MALLVTMSHFPHHWFVALVQPPRIVYIHNTTMSHHVRLDSHRLHVLTLIQPPRIRCTTTTTTTFPYDHSNVWNPQYLSQQRSRLFSFVAAVPSSILRRCRRRRLLFLPWHGYGVRDEHGYHRHHGIRTQRRSPLPYLYPNVTSLSSTTVVDPTPERMFTTTTTTTATTSKNHHTSHDDDDDHHDSNSRMVPMSDGQPTPDAADVVMDPKDTMVVPSSSSSSSSTTTNAAVVAATIKQEEQQQPILGTVSKDDVHKEEVKHKRLSEVKFVFFYFSCGLDSVFRYVYYRNGWVFEKCYCGFLLILVFLSFSALCALSLSLSRSISLSLYDFQTTTTNEYRYSYRKY
jgi:hypothetical protein